MERDEDGLGAGDGSLLGRMLALVLEAIGPVDGWIERCSGDGTKEGGMATTG